MKLPFFLLACLAMLSLHAADTRQLQWLGRLIHDDSPKVRLEALRSLAKIPDAKAAELALSVMDKPMDSTLDYALWLTINDLSEPWIAALQSGAWKPEGHEKQLEFALKAIKPEQASRVLTQVLKSRPLSRDGAGPWIEVIGQAGGPGELRALYDQAMSGGFDDPASARTLDSLAQAARLRKARPSGDLSALNNLYGPLAKTDVVNMAAIRLAVAWKDGLKPSVDAIARLAAATESGPALRNTALDALKSIGGNQAIAALTDLAAPARPADVRWRAVAALLAVNQGKALPLVADTVRSLADENAAQEFWRAALSVKGIGNALAESLPPNGIPVAAAKTGMRVAREGGRNELNLVVALAKASGLAADSGSVTGELVRDLAQRATQKGDPYRGEFVYRRSELACVTCHSIGGVGGKVGPDFTSIGASAQPDYLVESVLLPSAKIKEGFQAITVTTKAGDDITGTLARETQQELVLRLASGAEQTIVKNDISKREQSTASLMPSGLLDNLGEQDQLDLFAFLSRLGKPGDFDASKGGVARKWYLTQTVHTDAQAGQELWPLSAPFSDKRWIAADALVSGALTKQIVDTATKAQFWTSRLKIYAATEIKIAAAGKVQFRWTADPGSELWLDNHKIADQSPATVDLQPGSHRLFVRIDPQKVPDALRIESTDASFVLN
jgi:putative heme-binding domain-containing protein